MREPTKMCGNPACSREKPLSAFYRRSDSLDGHQAWCKDCSREKRAEWARDNRTRLRQLVRETDQRRRTDPERAAIERIRKREWYRRTRGTRPENYRRSPYTQGSDATVHLSPAPFAAWLLYVVERDGSTKIDTARRLGIPEKTFYRILAGSCDVGLAMVERALIADGTHLREVYEDLYDSGPVAR